MHGGNSSMVLKRSNPQKIIGGIQKMGEVIVVTSGKGGVGKTTTTANVGTGLAMLEKKVVLIDTDIGLRNLDVVMGLENRIVYNLVDVIEGTCRIRNALIKDKRYPNLYLLPSAQTRDKNAVTPEQMRLLCKDLAEEFDFVLIDCPAGIEQGFRNAIAGADRAIIVTTPEVSAVRDADRIIGLLESEGKHNPKLIINRIRPHMVKKGDMMDIDDIINRCIRDFPRPKEKKVKVNYRDGPGKIIKGTPLLKEVFCNPRGSRRQRST
jgi:septum site-determining protein MinD